MAEVVTEKAKPAQEAEESKQCAAEVDEKKRLAN